MFAFLDIAPRQDPRTSDFAVDEHTRFVIVSTDRLKQTRADLLVIRSVQAKGAGAFNELRAKETQLRLAQAVSEQAALWQCLDSQ